ncbi:23S rRNA (adenine(2503)-C(2))-methyltransferase RlmN [Buchnera aphidicola (Mollitrichosiphum nigrofasciatum)]|uniref:23S rRNA (adenine(2503)-C(2))-methyltransferase RlmN n=1 Tax=Buchnera aphidicola TaxID=9 RepID=UPI0031B8650F
MKINLLNFDRIKMRDFFISINEKYFHADQIMKWIYNHNCYDFNKMTNLSIRLRQKLIHRTTLRIPKIIKKLNSNDGTIKFLMQIDTNYIETIYIPEKKRNTICVSSQVGCVLKCDFCATGYMGFKRNLQVSEIIGQILNIKKKKSRKKLNIVFMGMGEPLLNFNNVITAVKIMLDPLGMCISKYNITLSTVGIIPGLEKLKNTIDIRLAISLHAPNNKLRSKIVPINKKYNIESILSTAKNYLNTSKTNKGGVTIEYVMLKDINDNIKFAQELVELLKNIPSKINLIPWNYNQYSKYCVSTYEQMHKFANILLKKGYIVKIRKNRGADINAACGQLSNFINCDL